MRRLVQGAANGAAGGQNREVGYLLPQVGDRELTLTVDVRKGARAQLLDLALSLVDLFLTQSICDFLSLANNVLALAPRLVESTSKFLLGLSSLPLDLLGALHALSNDRRPTVEHAKDRLVGDGSEN